MASKDLFYEWLRETTHLSQHILDVFKESKSNYVLIPPGAPRYLQPLDLAINKPFKDNMRKKYTEFVIKFGGNKKHVVEDLIEWVISSCYELNVISKDMIINFFKKTAISNKIDVTEDNMFE